MTTHELHTLLHDVSHQLHRENPGIEFRPEANGNILSLFVIYPDGNESRLSLELSEKDEIISQPAFHTATIGGNDNRDTTDSKLNEQWVALIKERIEKTSMDYSIEEAGGEG